MATEIKINVWLTIGERPLTVFQFLTPEEGAHALDGAIVIGQIVEIPDGQGRLVLWRPKRGWRDSVTCTVVLHQRKSFKAAEAFPAKRASNQ